MDRSRGVYTNDQVKLLQSEIYRCINILIGITADEINELRQLLKDLHLKDKDTSVILTACKLCQGGDISVIISDDPDFYEPWRILVKLGSFALGTTIYQTDKLMLRTYADFITLAHQCCSCPTDKYMALWNAWYVPIVARKIISLRQEGKTQLAGRVYIALTAMQDSINNKHG